jgi:acyl carrier protein
MGLDIVEMVLEVEKHFGVSLPDEEMAQAPTVGALHGLVLKHLRLSSTDPRVDQVFSELRDIVCRELGVRPEDVVPQAHLVHDLGGG